MSRKDKIQYLLVSHLLKEGHIQLTLPDGMVVELGTVMEDRYGQLTKTDNYCWIIASQKDREVSMDSYNLGLKYTDDNGKVILENDLESVNGRPIRTLNVI